MDFVVTCFRSKKNKQWYVHATSRNHKIVVPSEGYLRFSTALRVAKGFEKRLRTAIYTVLASSTGQYFIRGCARNHRITVSSQLYDHKSTATRTVLKLKTAKVLSIKVLN